MEWSDTISAGKVEAPNGGDTPKISKGSNSLAEDYASKLGLTKTSGYRTAEDSVKVGGRSDDDHVSGNASDFSGSPDKMEAYAQWAAKSGKFTKVIWKGKNLVTGTAIPGHYDHVHVSWKG